MNTLLGKATRRRAALTLAVAALVASAGVSAQKVPGSSRPYVDVASTSADAPATPHASSSAGGVADRFGIDGDWFYIIQLADPSVAQYRGENPNFRAPSRTSLRGNKLDPRSVEAQRYKGFLEAQQADFLADLARETRRVPSVLADYQFAFNGVVVRLSGEELEKVSRHPQVRLIEPVATHDLNTDVGPAFIGAPSIWDGSATVGVPGSRGEGVVIGVIDSGVNWQSPSFADVGADSYDHTNPLGAGTYLGVCVGQVGAGDPALGPACNDKVIGAYAKSFDFVQQVNFECANPDDPNNELGLTPAICTQLGVPLADFDLARDENGHGSHTAGTAAGSVADIVYRGNSLRISGVAPHANLVIYDACHTRTTGANAGQGSCFNFATLAAVEQVVEDGIVDVINYSIGGGAQPWTEAGSLAFLAAVDAGVFVSASAGNSGPAASSTGHRQPWVMTVANGTHTRGTINYEFSVTGPATPVPAGLVNQTMFLGAVGTSPTAAFVNTPLIVSPGIDTTADGCAAYPAGTFAGAIALIRRGTCAFAIKVENASAAGALAVFIANNQAGNIAPGGTSGVTFPVFGLNQVQANALRDYAAANAGTTVSIPFAAVIAATQGDVVNTSSSRGPSTFPVIKPDIMGPGTNVLAAVSGPATAYDLFTGTSMSAPHLAGSAALVRALQPTWSVAEIKSALMLTSKTQGVTKQDGLTAADPFDVGAGRVDLTRAATTGLVLDETTTNMQQANPSAGGNPAALNLASLQSNACVGSCSFARTVKSVSSVPVTYDVTFESASGLAASVSPATFTIAPGATQALAVTVNSLGATGGQWSFGELSFAARAVVGSTHTETTTPATPLAIPDNAYRGGFGGATMACVSVDTTGDLPAGATVADVRLRVAASHTWVGDLIYKLRNPAGTVLGVMSRPGANEADDLGTSTGNGDSSNLLDTFPIEFTDSAAASAESMGSVPNLGTNDVICRDLSSPCSYSPAPGAIAQPPANFAGFAGQNGEGVWMFCAGDRAGGDLGSVASVTLELDLGSVPAPTVHMPVAVFAIAPLATITTNPSSIQANAPSAGAAITRPLTVGNTGTVPLTWEVQSNPGVTTVWEQLRDSTGGIVSDFFIGDNSGAYTANDFTLDVATTLTEIFTPGFDNTNSLGAQPQITWAIFPDANGQPAGNPETNAAAALWEFSAPVNSSFVDITDGSITLDLAGAGEQVELAAGKYWLTVFPSYTNALSGGARWNWAQGTPLRGSGTRLISPILFGGVPAWTPLTDLGVAWADTAFTLEGTEACGAPWLTVAPSAGSVAPSGTSNLVVTMDPSGLVDATYLGNVCIASNDPARPVAVVPVTFVVGDRIFSNGFETVD